MFYPQFPRPVLSFDSIHFLLGNDLAENKKKIIPIVVEEPCFNQNPDLVEIKRFKTFTQLVQLPKR